MKDALTVIYPQEFGLSVDSVLYPLDTKCGDFTLFDTVACEQCVKSFPQKSVCDNDTLKVYTDHEIQCLHFEKYASQFDGTKASFKQRCDYLLFDEAFNKNKIVFCDLSCSVEKYILGDHGKIAEVIQKLTDSIEHVMANELLKVAVLGFPQKVGLLGWRDENKKIAPMLSYSVSPFVNTYSKSKSIMHGKMPHGFDFEIVRYPEVYQY